MFSIFGIGQHKPTIFGYPHDELEILIASCEIWKIFPIKNSIEDSPNFHVFPFFPYLVTWKPNDMIW